MSVHLRRLRLQNQLTLDQLAQAAGLTRSYLSKVERGLSSPSITVALQLAQVLGVTVEQLFQPDAPAAGVLVITRAADALAPPAGARLVSGALAGGRMSVFVQQPQFGLLNHPAGRHDGEELVYVLSGSVELRMAQACERLDAGDCAHFDSSVPHRIRSIGETPARILVVIAPFAEG
ncbi:XRE family transcriptional regulator [Pseudorhodoferax sp.]|uniref:XRE family transcriptional regulator n=1 Tax=Pseudorhodoferax sp. TaxID=1993553 RepID=UPI002DD6473B|nr:XRE family transcriptional regulator [Pseudorhodoferax sp.]